MKFGITGKFISFVQRAKKTTGEIFYLAKFHLEQHQCYVEVYCKEEPKFKVNEEVPIHITIDFEKQKYFLNLA